MSNKYGVKIKNYEAASVYGVNQGYRDSLQEKDAMLVNSLFLDFLYENGLEIYKETSTRDVICLEYTYGAPSYKEEITKQNSNIKKINNDSSLSYESKQSKIDFANSLISIAEINKDKFKKRTRQELRTDTYVNGIDVPYFKYDKKTNSYILDYKVHYKMLYRTPGKAKKGTCMFICDRLYDKAHEFLYMGYTLPLKNSPIVEIGAYASLITSSVIGRIHIEPEQILTIKDVKTLTVGDAVKICTNEARQCYAEQVENYDITGEAFDGQALIDSSIFPDWGDGYVLLRHHMTKCAAFSTNIELFMRDYYGDKYETAYITDMFGRRVKVSNIKLIVTNNTFKWIKFGITFEYWSEWVKKNGCTFGVVKTSHPSKLGDVQRMSYQMVNALDINTMEGAMKTTVDYINKLKSDDNVFVKYLESNMNFANDYEVLVALVKHNPEFVKCDYFRERKKEIIRGYINNFKSGRSIQNADNLTIVGSPYAMLLHSVGEDPRTDPTFNLENGCVQCWTARFSDNEYLAEFRNPFNSRNNLGHMHNKYHFYFDRYFNLGKLCIAVNTIDTDWQARNNGADQDSDSVYTTNNPEIVAHAKYCYANYPTIVNEIKPEKNIYDYSLENYAEIDNKLMAAQLAIGQSSNLAQLALTYTYNYSEDEPEYKVFYDYVCILAVLAQCAIDNAKRKFEVDLEIEIPRIKEDIESIQDKLPEFWLITKKDKRKFINEKAKKRAQKENKRKILQRIDSNINCPMNYLYNIKFEEHHLSPGSVLNIGDFVIVSQFNTLDVNRRKCKKVEELIDKYRIQLQKFYSEHESINWDDDHGEYYLLQENFDELIEDIRKIYISRNYADLMCWLINRAFRISAGVRRNYIDSGTNKNRALLLKVLYSINPDVFLGCFVK